MTEMIPQQSAGGNSLADRMEHAKALAQSGLIPDAFKKQPANVLVATELGDALGIAPIMAINEINVISGKPAMSASLMQSLARSAGHKVRVEGDDERAVCTIVRSDDQEFTHRAEWTKAKAEAAGLWGKGHWRKDPGLMLKWRAISECVRLACSEVLGGLKYTPEELVDAGAEQAPQQERQQAPQPQQWEQGPASYRDVRAQSAPSPEPQPEPQREPERDVVAEQIQAAWNNPDALQKVGKWMRSAHPTDQRVDEIIARWRELTAAQQAQTETEEAGAPEEPVQDAIIEEGTRV